MPKLYNKKFQNPPNAIYIGRPSKWGNPFKIGRDGTREEVIKKYEDYIYSSGLYLSLFELKDKDLICWCHPFPCHGDILLRLANS